jgi:hypothetical protein
MNYDQETITLCKQVEARLGWEAPNGTTVEYGKGSFQMYDLEWVCCALTVVF